MTEQTMAQAFLARYDQTEESPPLLTDDLDLTTLPERLDDRTLERLDSLARSPLPPAEPCDEKHLHKCLRIMLAVLPRQAADDISGELFVAAYQRKLGEWPNEAISFMTDKSTERCRWFPTIAECLEILGEWRRDDDYARRKRLAGDMARKERDARANFRWENIGRFQGNMAITQREVDQMSPEMIALGLSCGALAKSESGEVRPYFVDPDELKPA
jgi:hypothetical protein